MAEPLDSVGQAGSALGFVGALAWFARERGRRAQQLIRIEREGDLGDLEVINNREALEFRVHEYEKIKKLNSKCLE
jgi:hypothetical protein